MADSELPIPVLAVELLPWQKSRKNTGRKTYKMAVIGPLAIIFIYLIASFTYAVIPPPPR